jgi:hypothetical protein
VSRALVAAAADAPAAFDPTPPPDSLQECHVPFEQLTGVGELESTVASRVERYARIALTGPIGCGKSSVARYALRQWGGPLAPIWINVATEDQDRVATVRGFLEILVSQLSARADRANRITEEQRTKLLAGARPMEGLGTIDTKTGGELGGSYWLITGKLSREVSRTLPLGESYRATEDVRQAARDALSVIAGQDRIPVLVCDDTDRLLRVGAGANEGDALFAGFFGPVLRDLSEHLECGLIVAAHDSYKDHDDYADLTVGLLEDMPIPPLDNADQIAQIVSARVEFVDEGASAAELVSREGLERLAELHSADHARSMRKTLAVLRSSLSLAAGQGADLVERRHIDAAETDR